MICLSFEAQDVTLADSLAAFSAGSSIAARIAMIAITMRSSIRVKIFVFTLEVRTEEQETIEQFNNRKKKEEVGSGDWQRPALLCCRRNETSFLHLFLMRSFMRVKILIFTLRSKNIELGILREEVEKHWNNRRKQEARC